MSETAAVTQKKEPGMAQLVIVLFAISAITALLLGLVNMITAPQIAINNQKKTDDAMAAVLPADSYTQVEYTVKSLPLPACQSTVTPLLFRL